MQVVDFSDPHHREQMQVTQKTLQELGAQQIPCLYVMNKADQVMERSRLPRVSQDHIYLSAKEGIGVEKLVELIQEKLYAGLVDCEMKIPYTDGSAVSYLQQNAVILQLEYEADGVYMRLRCRRSDAGRYSKYKI